MTCSIQTKKVRCKAWLSKHSLSQFLFILMPNLHLQYSMRSRRVRVDATCTTAAHRVAVLQHLQHDHWNKSAHCPQNHVHNGNTIWKDHPGKTIILKSMLFSNPDICAVHYLGHSVKFISPFQLCIIIVGILPKWTYQERLTFYQKEIFQHSPAVFFCGGGCHFQKVEGLLHQGIHFVSQNNNQQTRELISAWQMSHWHSNKDLSPLQQLLPGMRVNTRYINSIKSTYSKGTRVAFDSDLCSLFGQFGDFQFLI